MMTREDAKIRVKLNVNKLFLSGEVDTYDDYADSVNYSYVDENEKFYRLAGLIR
ncbi:hypothetical protein NO2_0463 [Candidatus Termititenax persephonae]|uniref:Uncharacterized protein n=1 Tax=Candidatus Termititenax persephonae TaxID=2218525 RepID=A0A388TGC1_9BACT|nr:hypothetical protein NO2_0463 [Candidatus Termititenax persephonae]